MDWFSLCLDILVITAQGVLHMGFVCRLTKRTCRPWYAAGYVLLLMGIEAAGDFYRVGEAAARVVQLLALYGMSRFLLKNKSAVSWTAAVLAVYITQLSFGMINSVEAIVIVPAVRGPWLYGLLLLMTAAAFAIWTVCGRLVLKWLTPEADGQLPYMALLLLPSLFLFSAELYIVRTAYASVPVAFSWAEAGRHLVLLCLQAMGLGALCCMLYAWRGVCRAWHAQAALASLEQAVHAQKACVAQARLRYEGTQAFRHDIRNHLSVLKGLLEAGKTEEAKRYLAKTEAVSASLSYSCHTGNPVADVLLEEKLAVARAAQIETDVTLQLPSSCGIDDFDWCVLLANALDNATAGCKAVPCGRRYLCVEGRFQGTFYFLSVENSCREDLQGAPAEGTGLANIRAAAGKYGGTVRAAAAGGVFRLELLLILPGDRGKKPVNG